jgi:hypothetical protein
MKAGDRLKVTAGDDLIELTIPPLDAVIFVQTDTVNGHTLPNAKVNIQISSDPTGGATVSGEATADAAGNFSHSFSGVTDLRYGDFVQLGTEVGGHTVLNTTVAPGLLLDLDQALLLGSLAPRATATVRLQRGNRTVSEQTTGADESGAFAVAFTDAEGMPLVLEPLDVITVTPSDAGVDPLSLVVPDLTIQADPATDAIDGRATSGGSLTMLAVDSYSRAGTLGIAQAWPAVGADNRYATDFVPRVDVRPGTRIYALYRPPAGHYVVRTHTVPILNAQHSGPSACGFGEPRRAVDDTLVDAGGASLATAETRALYDGFFSLVLRNAAQAPVASAAGHTERVNLGTTPVTTKLPPLDLTVDWQRGLVQGAGPANTPFFLDFAVPCPAQQPGGFLNINIRIGGFQQQTGPDGSLQAQLPPGVGAPGTGLEVALYTANDHRVFRHVYRALAQIFIHHDRVTGRVNALDGVTLVLKGPGGAERSRAQLTAGPTGRYDVRLKDAGGQPVTIAAGDVVTLQTSTEAPEVIVEPLSFDWSPGHPLVGQAPAGRTVDVILRLANDDFVSIPRPVDANGSFRFTAADVPPRAGWTYDDVVALRVVLETPGGHQIIDQTDLFETGPTQPDGHTIYLPMTYTPRRATLATATGATGRAPALEPGAVKQLWRTWTASLDAVRADGSAEAPANRPRGFVLPRRPILAADDLR